MKKSGPLSVKNLLALAILGFSLIAGVAMIETPDVPGGTPAPLSSPQSLKADWDHILHGDETGGGHLHGTGTPCKSEFPEDWTSDIIKTEVLRLAANDNAPWRTEENGYWVSEQKSGKLNIRIVFNPKKQEIVTAYPVGVPRNPCPANDNRP